MSQTLLGFGAFCKEEFRECHHCGASGEEHAAYPFKLDCYEALAIGTRDVHECHSCKVGNNEPEFVYSEPYVKPHSMDEDDDGRCQRLYNAWQILRG
jgi:hypothetical protein|tara:strand:+ start:104 stop:394 length:291 start_codon:yes stop_codon:yes gene_type:complete